MGSPLPLVGGKSRDSQELCGKVSVLVSESISGRSRGSLGRSRETES